LHPLFTPTKSLVAIELNLQNSSTVVDFIDVDFQLALVMGLLINLFVDFKSSTSINTKHHFIHNGLNLLATSSH
jgi:hypothetical protein